MNAGQSVTCAEIAEDSSLLAVGFNESMIKVFSVQNVELKEMKSAEQLKDIDRDADDVLARMMDEKTAEKCKTFLGHSGPVYRCSFARIVH